jgi:hypothetical protein
MAAKPRVTRNPFHFEVSTSQDTDPGWSVNRAASRPISNF